MNMAAPHPTDELFNAWWEQIVADVTSSPSVRAACKEAFTAGWVAAQIEQNKAVIAKLDERRLRRKPLSNIRPIADSTAHKDEGMDRE